MTKAVSECTFKRQSTFKYKMKKDASGQAVKMYKPKTAELKIEFYEKEAQFENKSDKKGHKDLNLSDYINKGLQTQTFKMDAQGYIFLTVKIAVLQSDAQLDVATMTLMSLNQQMRNNQGKEVSASTTQDTIDDSGDEDSDGSDDEYEIGGDVMKQHFEHFTKVIAPKSAQPQEQQDDDDQKKNKSKVVGALKTAVQGAITMNSIVPAGNRAGGMANFQDSGN